MRRFTLWILFIAFSSPLQASLKEKVRDQIRVEAQLLVNGKVVSTPSVLALAGEKAQITVGAAGGKDMMRMKVLANMADPRMDEIVLDMDLKFTNAGREIRSSPQVYVKSGVAALMTLEESTPGEKIQLKVTARPVIR